MLLNEFFKEHTRVQELEATVAQQRKDSEATAVRQQKQIDALTAGLQKVTRTARSEQTCAASRRKQLKYWEIIADKLSKAGWSWARSQAWIPKGEKSELQPNITRTTASNHWPVTRDFRLYCLDRRSP